VLVYAIEASTMAEQAELIVQANAMQDRITVMHGRIEVSISHFDDHIPDEPVFIGCCMIAIYSRFYRVMLAQSAVMRQ